MCRTTTLYHSRLGMVRTCIECGRYQVAFGLVGLDFTTQQFECFVEDVIDLKVDEDICEVKSFWVELPTRSCCLLLNGQELKDLQHILIHAQQELYGLKIASELGLESSR